MVLFGSEVPSRCEFEYSAVRRDVFEVVPFIVSPCLRLDKAGTEEGAVWCMLNLCFINYQKSAKTFDRLQ